MAKVEEVRQTEQELHRSLSGAYIWLFQNIIEAVLDLMYTNTEGPWCNFVRQVIVVSPKP